MENIDLHYCSKFEEDLTVFGVVMAQKPPKSPPKWYFLVVGEHLNIDNLATTKAFFFFFFFNCYLAVPRPTLGHSQGDSLTNPMLITAFVHIRPEGPQEPRNEVGSLSPAERLAGFEPGGLLIKLTTIRYGNGTSHFA